VNRERHKIETVLPREMFFNGFGQKMAELCLDGDNVVMVSDRIFRQETFGINLQEDCTGMVGRREKQPQIEMVPVTF
jgi:hypothetical protein